MKKLLYLLPLLITLSACGKYTIKDGKKVRVAKKSSTVIA